MILRFLFVSIVLLLNACASVDGPPADFSLQADKIKNAVPRNQPVSRYGNPPSYTVRGKTYRVMKTAKGFVQKGNASWYGTKFHGRLTSSGEPYNMYAMTAAHKTLPLPSYVEVHNLKNDRRIIVKVNDRGPFHEGRIIDLSYAAAHKLGITGTGTAPVEIRVIDTGKLALDTSDVVLPKTSHPDGKGSIHIQVAAMATESAAEKMARELRRRDFNSVRVNVAEVNHKKLYRVRIGPVPDVHLAYKILNELSGMGMKTARVVVD